jgi:hypothetical protein
MTTDTEPTVTVHPMAMGVLRAIASDLEAIGDTIGRESTVYRAMSDSWLRASGNVWRLLEGGGSLSRDDSRSLYIVTGYGMHVGVIFFADRDTYKDAMVAGTDPMMPHVNACSRHNGAAYPSTTEHCAGHPGEGAPVRESFCIRRTIPMPGTWSLHS